PPSVFSDGPSRSRLCSISLPDALPIFATDPDRQIASKASAELARLRSAAGRPGPPPAATAGTTSPPPPEVDWDVPERDLPREPLDRKSTRLNSSHVKISYAVSCLKNTL